MKYHDSASKQGPHALMKLLLILLFSMSSLSYSQMNLSDRIKKDDSNHDGKVSKEEFKGPPNVFERLDKNRDGELDAEEIEAATSQKGPQNPATQGSDPFDQSGQNKTTGKLSSTLTYVKDIEYGKGGGKPLYLDYLCQKQVNQKLPVIIFVHGGGWQSGSKESAIFTQLQTFAEDGYFCVSINYRLTGEAEYPAQIEDCKCAVRFLRANAQKWNLDTDRFGAWGSSAGGHLVALLGTTAGVDQLEGVGGYENFSSRVQAVVDWFGPVDLAKSYSGHLNAESPEGKLLGKSFPNDLKKIALANPITFVTPDDAPFLILHGDADTVVPPKMSEELAHSLTAVQVEATYILFPGEKHGGFKDKSALSKTKEFFDRILKAK